MDVEVNDLGEHRLADTRVRVRALGDQSVNDDVWRSIPTARLLSHATAMAASLCRVTRVDPSSGETAFDILADIDGATYEKRLKLAKPVRPGQPDPQEVVRVVREAEARGETAAVAVGDRWHLSQSRAYELIKKVRPLLAEPTNPAPLTPR